MFQKTIAQGRFTLAVVALFTLVAWGVLPPEKSWLLGGGFLLCAVTVYLLAELNNAFVLLRINSHMMSGTLALLLAPAVMLHELHGAHVILLCSVVAYFPLFATYQRPRATVFTYLAYMLLGLSSFVCPQLLLFVPVCWMAQVMLRSLCPRSWVASLLGVATPYCFLFTWAYCTDGTSHVFDCFAEMLRFGLPDFTAWTVLHYVVASLALLHFAVGTVDFVRNRQLDKTRIRFHYYVVLLFGTAAFVWLLLQPQNFVFIMPLCMVNAAMLSAHFSALSYGRVQNIIVIVLTVLTLGACVVPMLPVNL